MRAEDGTEARVEDVLHGHLDAVAFMQPVPDELFALGITVHLYTAAGKLCVGK